MASAQAEKTILEQARGFRPRIVAERARFDADRRIPSDLARDLAQAGLFRLSLPAVYGGLDLAPAESLEVFEELAEADASVAWCVWNGNTYWTAPLLEEHAAREIFADPSAIFANSTQPKGQATLMDEGYSVQGRWSLVSGCQLSDWLQLLCVVHQDGAPVMQAPGVPTLKFMFVRTSDCEIVETWDAGGLRGTGSHDVVVRDVFVPARHASWFLDPPALADPRYRLPSFSRVIPGLGAVGLGIARTAIDSLIVLGGAKGLAEDAAAGVRLAEAEAMVRAARLFLYDAVHSLWEEVLNGGEPTLALRTGVRLATNHAVTSAVRAVDLAYLTGGASSVYATNALERASRDVHVLPQHVASNPKVMETAGRVLFGLDPGSPVF